MSLCLEDQIRGRTNSDSDSKFGANGGNHNDGQYGQYGDPGKAVQREAGCAARRTSPLASKLVRVQPKTGTGMLVALSPSAG